MREGGSWVLTILGGQTGTRTAREETLQDSELKRLLTPHVGLDLGDTAGESVSW